MNHYVLSVILVCGACAPADDDLDGLGQLRQAGTSVNGLSVNGTSVNGMSVNGMSVNGVSLTGVAMNGTTAAGSSISVGPASGPPLAGKHVVSSTWIATADNGAQVKLRIDGATAGTGPNADLWFYAVSYQTATGWSPLCGVDASGAPVLALTVAGTWNATANDLASYSPSATQFTLACRGKTVAKCVELGYKPYKGRTSQLTSCVRLLRGDFCGTGVSYTVDGNLLNVYDNIGVQADTQAWAPEAEWTPSGARCINAHNAARYDLVVSRDPRCVRHIKTTSCGTTFANSAVLIDELSPSVVTAIETASD